MTYAKKVKSGTADLVVSIILDVLIVVFTLLIVIPLVWMVISSFKGTNEIFSNIWGFPGKWRV